MQICHAIGGGREHFLVLTLNDNRVACLGFAIAECDAELFFDAVRVAIAIAKNFGGCTCVFHADNSTVHTFPFDG